MVRNWSHWMQESPAAPGAARHGPAAARRENHSAATKGFLGLSASQLMPAGAADISAQSGQDGAREMAAAAGLNEAAFLPLDATAMERRPCTGNGTGHSAAISRPTALPWA